MSNYKQLELELSNAQCKALVKGKKVKMNTKHKLYITEQQLKDGTIQFDTEQLKANKNSTIRQALVDECDKIIEARTKLRSDIDISAPEVVEITLDRTITMNKKYDDVFEAVLAEFL